MRSTVAREMTILARMLALIVCFAAVFAFSQSSLADEVTPGCSARIDGQDIRPTTEGNPVVLKPDATVEVMGSSAGAVKSYKVKLSVGLFGFTAASGPGDGNEWDGKVNVADYSRFGAGLYKVSASTTGASPCQGTGWVRIDRNPLTTVAGLAGAGFGIFGLAGLLFSLTSKAVVP